MGARRKYVRVYYDDLFSEFPQVCADPAALGTWLYLLVVAERSWPAAPDLPRSARARPLRALIDAGLVAVNGHQFGVRGLAAERTRRAAAARIAAATRWQSDSNADALPSTRTTPSTSTKLAPQPPTSGGQGFRANGTSPRQLAERARLEEREQHRVAAHSIHQRYLRGEINEAEEQRLYAELDMEPDDLRRKVPAS